MSFALPDLLPVSISRVTPYGAACIAALFVAMKFVLPSKLDAIPTVGSSGRGWLGAWGPSAGFVANGIEVLQEGYNKYKYKPFKMAGKDGWTVMISSHEHVEELRKAPDDELSFQEATMDVLNIRDTQRDENHDAAYRAMVIRSRLTRNIEMIYADIRDEIETSFDEILDLSGNEWKSVPALSTIQNVVCRTSNRAFVGLPLCRDPEWIDLNIRYTLNIIKIGDKLRIFPKILRPLAVRFFADIAQDTTRGERILGPIIEERRKCWTESSTERPNDFLTWLMEEMEASQPTARRLTGNILTVNFSAIHTTAISFTHGLLYLAANPEFILPLREEVRVIVENEGWSRTALNKMCKLDSFLRECQRLEGINAVNVWRKAMKDFRFSDGIFIPKGTMIGVTTRCLHYDAEFYEDPSVFKPFRFVGIQEEENEGARYQFTSPSAEYLPFGYGRHICPGRFFAANVMKTMLAHVVMTYDVKMEDGTTRPPSLHFGPVIAADPHAKALFRRRVD